MKPERWRRIEQLYYEALELESFRREAFLDQSCAGDEFLRKEVDSLLQVRVEAGSFIESPAVEVAARALFGRHADGDIKAPGNEQTRKIGEDRAPAKPGRLTENHPRRAPWWMYIIAAGFLTCAAARYYHCFVAQVDDSWNGVHPFQMRTGCRPDS